MIIFSTLIFIYERVPCFAIRAAHLYMGARQDERLFTPVEACLRLYLSAIFDAARLSAAARAHDFAGMRLIIDIFEYAESSHSRALARHAADRRCHFFI